MEAGIVSTVQASELTLIQSFCGKLPGVVAVLAERSPEEHSDTGDTLLVEGGKYHLGPKLMCNPKAWIFHTQECESLPKASEPQRRGRPCRGHRPAHRRGRGPTSGAQPRLRLLVILVAQGCRDHSAAAVAAFSSTFLRHYFCYEPTCTTSAPGATTVDGGNLAPLLRYVM